MNILRIARKYIRQTLKRPVGLVLLIIGPLALMFILAQAFAGIFSMGQAAPEMHIGYYSREKGPLYEGFREFLKEGASLHMTGEEVESIESGELKTREGIFHGCVILYEKEKRVELVLNNNTGIQAGIIEGMVHGFTDRFSLYSLMYQQAPGISRKDPGSLARMAAGSGNYITHTPLGTSHQPRAIDYFGVTIVTMSILFGAFLGMYGVEKEKSLGTLQRLYAAPVTPLEFFLGTCLGTMAALALQLATLLILGKYVLGIYYGERFLIVIILLAGESFFALALGISISYLLSNSKAATGILNMIIPLLNFMGGSYMKLPDTRFFNILSTLSPIGLMNKALFELIFSTTSTFVLPALVYCIAGASVLLGISILQSLRRKTV